MNISTILKKRREKICMTQQDLASSAGVSITTIQNIECGVANPSLKLLEQISDNLGIKLVAKEVSTINLDALAKLGLPISAIAPTSIIKSKKMLLHHLKLGCITLLDGHLTENDRIEEAFESLILAIRDHYPSFYKRHISRVDFIVNNFIPKTITGRHIKLRRISLSILGEYL